MTTSSENFAYQDGAQGVRFTAVAHCLSAACLSEREIDTQRDKLKDELGEVAGRMKAALRRRPSMALPNT